MLDDYGFETFEENEFPLAYLIMFRTYGTWLHGDERTSICRSNGERPGTVRLDPNVPLEQAMMKKMLEDPVVLNRHQRQAVAEAIDELCGKRGYGLRARNVRTTHVHSVVSAARSPERIADAMKAFATKRLRELGLIGHAAKVWSRGRSRRYLWKPAHVEAAINYVLYCQGDVPFELDERIQEPHR